MEQDGARGSRPRSFRRYRRGHQPCI